LEWRACVLQSDTCSGLELFDDEFVSTSFQVQTLLINPCAEQSWRSVIPDKRKRTLERDFLCAHWVHLIGPRFDIHKSAWIGLLPLYRDCRRRGGVVGAKDVLVVVRRPELGG
jgi:hypothetical protein